jgi:predicted ATPase
MIEQVTPFQPRELQELISRYRYHRQVFVLPPWEAIYTTDDERDQTFADALRVHAMLDTWYRRCGYDVVEVPRTSVAERYVFVLNTLVADDPAGGDD